MIISKSKLFVFTKTTLMAILIFFPIFAQAEYYFVKTKLEKKYCHCRHTSIYRYRKHSNDRQSHHISRRSTQKHYFARIYQPCYEKNYNLDMITGDDDPYIYPGMNIDR